ncbi:MAG: hypothetical protein ACRDND_28270, partial [Streptosporangiaceae bacterium]
MAPGSSAPPFPRPRARRHPLVMAFTALACLCCLAVAALAGRAAVAGQTRPPTPAERAAAASA